MTSSTSKSPGRPPINKLPPTSAGTYDTEVRYPSVCHFLFNVQWNQKLGGYLGDFDVNFVLLSAAPEDAQAGPSRGREAQNTSKSASDPAGTASAAAPRPGTNTSIHPEPNSASSRKRLRGHVDAMDEPASRRPRTDSRPGEESPAGRRPNSTARSEDDDLSTARPQPRDDPSPQLPGTSTGRGAGRKVVDAAQPAGEAEKSGRSATGQRPPAQSKEEEERMKRSILRSDVGEDPEIERLLDESRIPPPLVTR